MGLEQLHVDAAELLDTVNQVMPFGRFRGRRLIELPEPYLVWFHNEGFPNGTLGRRMAVMYEIKVNGLETMLAPLIGRTPADVAGDVGETPRASAELEPTAVATRSNKE